MNAISTIDVANSLILAAVKADTLKVALRLVMDPLEPGRTRDILERAIYYLDEVKDDLITEGNTLQRYAAAEVSE